MNPDELEGLEFQMVDRAPIAAVSDSKSRVVVVCTDGAAFRLTLTGQWDELEPVPGTPRAMGLDEQTD